MTLDHEKQRAYALSYARIGHGNGSADCTAREKRPPLQALKAFSDRRKDIATIIAQAAGCGYRNGRAALEAMVEPIDTGPEGACKMCRQMAS